MLRRIFVVATVALGLALVGCGGGGGNPVTSANVPTGSVEGKLVTGSSTTSKSRQVATSFIAKVHGLENTFRLQLRTNGEFRIDGVPAGEQVISLEDEKNQQGDVFVCLVRPNQVTNVGEVVPEPWGMIAGTVRDKNGQIKPVARALIVAHPISFEELEHEPDETIAVKLSSRPFFTDFTDKDGKYRLLVPEGTYLVEVRHPDYEPALEGAIVEAAYTEPLDFNLTPIPVQNGIVYGTVMAQVKGDLLPVPGALVMLKP
ncbi:MAG: carboxypeptidase-like regulatory domain-containing protein, partial [Candidatus Fervidibacter sp.]|uniref:carboxypeptidase-like regulatory domain-containing protein n=1 Tax=Candidatus Fervidibacter sp. TaxID=3100871 RepID=UPI00404B8298